MNWEEYFKTRFTDPAASMAWMIVVRDPFYLYDGKKFIDRQTIEYPTDLRMAEIRKSPHRELGQTGTGEVAG